jgi:hypothetical protein
MKTLPTLAVLACLAPLAAASDGLRVTTVHRPGDPAPDLPGLTLGGVGDNVSINDRGDILFVAGLAGPGVTSSNNFALFGGPRDNLRLLAREQDPIDALPGFIWLPGSINLTGFSNLVVTSTGEVGFNPTIFQVGVSSAVLASLFAGPVTAPTPLLWQTGDPPGFDPAYSIIALNPGVLASGARAAVIGRVTGPSTERVIWFGNPNDGMIAALQTNLQAPGLPIGVNIANIDDQSLRMNEQGRIAFHATLPLGNGVTQSNRTVLYEGLPDNVGILARTGDPLPGVPGAVYQSLDADSIRMNAAGAVCFQAGVIGGGTDGAIVSKGSGIAFTLAKDGDPVPGAPGLSLNNVRGGYIDMNGNGRVIFAASLAGAPFATDTAVFIGDPTGIEMILREGDPLPGGFAAPDLLGLRPFFNDRGQVAFSVTVNDRLTFFATRPNGEFVKLARASEVFVTDDGFVGVSGALVPWRYDSNARNPGSGGPSMFNSHGELVLPMYFSGATGSALVLFDIDDPCPADLAEPFGLLDLADIAAFVDGFVNQTPPGDLDGNGLWELTDITIFVGSFNAGCP